MTDPAADLLAETREELSRADNKANMLFGALGIGASVLVAGIVSRDIKFDDMSGGAQVLAVVAALLGALALVQLARAVWPRCGKPVPRRARYFVEVNQFDGDVEAVADVINSDAEHGDRNVTQLIALSKLVELKYQHIQYSVWFAAGGLVAAILAAVLY